MKLISLKGILRNYKEKILLFLLKRKIIGLKETTKEAVAQFFTLFSDNNSNFYINLIHSLGYVYKENFNEPDIENNINNLKCKPLISIIMPVYNAAPKWLDLAIRSLENQFYENWELCIADDCSINQDIIKFLKKINNPRIKIVFLEKKQGTSVTSNAAIGLASGDYIGFLDNDGELTRDALYETVKNINKTEADFIYSDEDFITERGVAYSPHFKSDFNYDLLMCHNYINHFSVVKKTIIDEIGGFNNECSDAQNYDLILRITEKANKVAHIQKVLYHSRVVAKSTNVNSAEKQQYSDRAGKKALTNALKRRGIDGIVTYGNLPCYYDVRRKINGNPLVSIIIPFKNQATMLERCISTILARTSYGNYEIIAINNNSDEQATFDIMNEMLALDPRVRFLDYKKTFNYSAINNWGVANHAKGEHVLLLNNDIEIIHADWLKSLLEHSQRSEVGAVGGMLIYPNNTIQHAGLIIGMGHKRGTEVAGHIHKHFPLTSHGYLNRINLSQNLSAVTAACLMVKRDIYNEVNGFDEQQLAIAFNDVDFCLRIREKGYLNVYTPSCKAYHYESLSRGYDDVPEKIKRFEKECKYMRKRHKDIIKNGDPYYNSNLSYASEDVKVKLG